MQISNTDQTLSSKLYLEPSQPEGQRPCLRGDDDDGGVGPVGRGHARHEVADAGAVLGDAHAGAVGHAGQAVGHVDLGERRRALVR